MLLLSHQLPAALPLGKDPPPVQKKRLISGTYTYSTLTVPKYTISRFIVPCLGDRYTYIPW